MNKKKLSLYGLVLMMITLFILTGCRPEAKVLAAEADEIGSAWAARIAYYENNYLATDERYIKTVPAAEADEIGSAWAARIAYYENNYLATDKRYMGKTVSPAAQQELSNPELQVFKRYVRGMETSDDTAKIDPAGRKFFFGNL